MSKSSVKKLSSFEDACEIYGKDPGVQVTPQERSRIIYRAACILLDKDENATTILHGKDNYFVSLLAHYKLMVIRDGIVGDWAPDWNKNTRKWTPVFLMNDPGFRFHGAVCDYAFTCWSGGSRLSCETESQAEFFGKDCVSLWADFYGAEQLAPAQAV